MVADNCSVKLSRPPYQHLLHPLSLPSKLTPDDAVFDPLPASAFFPSLSVAVEVVTGTLAPDSILTWNPHSTPHCIPFLLISQIWSQESLYKQTLHKSHLGSNQVSFQKKAGMGYLGLFHCHQITSSCHGKRLHHTLPGLQVLVHNLLKAKLPKPYKAISGFFELCVRCKGAVSQVQSQFFFFFFFT